MIPYFHEILCKEDYSLNNILKVKDRNPNEIPLRSPRVLWICPPYLK